MGFYHEKYLGAKFHAHFVEVVMTCITSATFEVMVNGGCTESFLSQHGIQQGFPMCPYIFTLCIQQLSSLIQHLVDEGSWKPIVLARGGTKLSHNLFADDLTLFGESSAAQAQSDNYFL